MKILILGHANHGKDTVAKYLAQEFNLVNSSATDYLATHFVFPVWGYKHYANVHSMLEDKDNHRLKWASIVNQINRKDKLFLCKQVMFTSDIYSGMRNQKEYIQAVKENIFDYILFVSAGDRLPTENSMNIVYDSRYMHIVDNSLGLPNLRNNLKPIIKLMKENNNG